MAGLFHGKSQSKLDDLGLPPIYGNLHIWLNPVYYPIFVDIPIILFHYDSQIVFDIPYIEALKAPFIEFHYYGLPINNINNPIIVPLHYPFRKCLKDDQDQRCLLQPSRRASSHGVVDQLRRRAWEINDSICCRWVFCGQNNTKNHPQDNTNHSYHNIWHLHTFLWDINLSEPKIKHPKNHHKWKKKVMGRLWHCF